MAQSSGSILIDFLLKLKPLFGYALVMAAALIIGIWLGSMNKSRKLQFEYDNAQAWNTSLNQQLNDEEAKRVSLEMQFGKVLSNQSSPLIASIHLSNPPKDGVGDKPVLTVGQEKLMIELDLEKTVTNHSEYNVSIANQKRQTISECGSLDAEPSSTGSIVRYWVAAEPIQSGDYEVQLYGTNAAGTREPIAKYWFRLEKN